MSGGLTEQECPQCHGVIFYLISYQRDEWEETGVRGGYTADLIPPHDVTKGHTTWSGEDYCRCVRTDAEREALEMAMAKDYGEGWEPAVAP